MDLNQFIQDNKITLSLKRVDSNPSLPGMANNYKATLRFNGHQLTMPFSTGSAWETDPTAADVLDCLASDASGYENASGFEDWARDYGYSPDSRKAEKIYKTVKSGAVRLQKLLGLELYQELLWNVERL